MIHTAILIGYLAAGWTLAAGLLALVPRLPRWGDRRALHQLAIASPLLAMGLAGAWSAQMALTGCLHFTTADGIGTLLLMIAVASALGVAAVRETLRLRRARERLARLSPQEDAALAFRALRWGRELGLRRFRTRRVEVSRPFAATIGFPATLVLSRGLLDLLGPEEVETVLAHEVAHLRHQDALLAWLDASLLGAFAFMPPLRRAWEESLLEREEAADVAASQATGLPLVLAGALLKLAEAARDEGTPRQDGLHDDLSLLERRIERLLSPAPEGDRAWGWPALAALLFGLALPLAGAWGLGWATACVVHL